jgi:dethiobiotin synthetase
MTATGSAYPGLVILGTDTAAGKTTFACGLLRLAHRMALAPVPYKPIETGCDPVPQDALSLLFASRRVDLTPTDICPLQLRAPVAPALAASMAGLTLSLPEMIQTAHRLARRGQLLVVETAGGLLCPYGPGFTSADLAAALALPIVLVAPNRLGTINHTALAIAELQRRRLPLAALVLVDTSAQATPDRPHNADLIATQTAVRALVTLPFVPQADPDVLADALAAQIPPADLFRLFGVGELPVPP